MTARNVLLLTLLASPPAAAQSDSASPWRDPAAPRSSAWLSLLPEGEAKRKFILDCTGCHQFDARIARPGGTPRTEAQWVEAITRMLGYAGATTSFPVIAADRDPEATAAWLARHLPAGEVREAPIGSATQAEITEYMMPEPQDLPHDVAVEPGGSVLVTGMFTHRLYRVNPATGAIGEIPIPVPNANPRAIELDGKGRPWLVLGSPAKVATLADSQWRTFDVGMYAHSLAVGTDGKVWFNGHFTRAPEQIGSVDAATGAVRTHDVPAHPTLAAGPGGPIPYELRPGPDGRVWMSELQGNRLVAFTPKTGKFETFTLPTPHSGPRRFDVDAKGIVWIPAYSANRLVRLDPATGRFQEIDLPGRDVVPYIVRSDPRDGSLWIGTAAADALLRYRPESGRFDAYPLPTRGALVRHLAIDPKSGAVWLAYGASPGIPARIARVVPR
jgi:virginiamycin B lyase